MKKKGYARHTRSISFAPEARVRGAYERRGEERSGVYMREGLSRGCRFASAILLKRHGNFSGPVSRLLRPLGYFALRDDETLLG